MNHQIQYLMQKHGKNFNNLVDNGDWLGDGHDLYEAYCYEQKMLARHRVTQLSVVQNTRTPRRTRQATRSSAKSGDSNTDDAEPEPEPERPLLQSYLKNQRLLKEQDLADFLGISKKSVQNIYSATPWLLPPAIQIPGARGPRWTPQAVQDWLQNRPQHTPKPIPVAPKRKAGRPRIALAGKGGAA
jgi:predicted DNA-binding transcriptional regulator AlpA